MSEFKPGQAYRRNFGDRRLEYVRAIVDDTIVVIRSWNRRAQEWQYSALKAERLARDIQRGYLTLEKDAPA